LLGWGPWGGSPRLGASFDPAVSADLVRRGGQVEESQEGKDDIAETWSTEQGRLYTAQRADCWWRAAWSGFHRWEDGKQMILGDNSGPFWYVMIFKIKNTGS
jgi:hypothetical protein